VGSGPQISRDCWWRPGELGANVNVKSGTKSAMPPSTSKKRRSAQLRKAATSSRTASVDYETIARFRYELRRFLAFSEIEANRSGLSAQQYQALMAIRGFSTREPVSIGDLARYMLIRHHTAVELVDRMVRLKIVSRSTDPSDGRRVLLALTREGERGLRRLYQMHVHELRTMGPTLMKMLKLFKQL
jgi:DNA-binding MarR family transcriptional regulator